MLIWAISSASLASVPLPAQAPSVQTQERAQQERAKAAMQPSLEKQRVSAMQQRASVIRQRGAAQWIAPAEVRWSGTALPIAAVPMIRTQPVGSLAVAAATPAWTRPNCPPVSGSALNELIGAAASQFQLDPGLLREVARQESAFYPCSESAKGAQGLMQLMPVTQRMLEVENPFDPQENIFAGAQLLSALLKRYGGDLALALSAYNAGPSRVDQTGDIPLIPETQDYVATILGRLGMFPD